MDSEIRSMAIGRGKLMREGDELTILAIGNRVWPAVEAAKELEKEGVRAAVVNCRFVKPLDKELILQTAQQSNRVITVEENVLQGGFGSAVLELLAEEGLTGIRVVRLGIDDEFIEHASQKVQRSICSIDTSAIVTAARALVAGDTVQKAASQD